jgi:UDP:flavonoid glycosyltransferase YjiC (YdhE family)
MRVLFISVSALGHVHPMVPLARAVLDGGHDVHWLTGPDAVDRLRNVGFAAESVGQPFEDLRAEYRRRYPEAASLRGSDLPEHVFPRLFGEIAAADMLAGDVRFAREWHPDLIVHDAATFAGPIVAALVGVPSVTHGFGALTPIHRVVAAAEMAAPLWRSVGLEPRPFGGLYDHLYLDIYPPSLEVDDMGHVPRRQPLRPVAFDDARDAPSVDFAARPDAPPLVYLTLGTVDRDRSALRTALEAIAAHPVRVLVTVGPMGDPATLGSQPAHVQVERYVPQTRVLPHCAVVVSHAGSGTFLATLAQGVPQLCLPQAADQFMNAAACRRAGAGLVLQPDEVTASAIDGALTRLLAEESFREAADRVRAEIAVMPGPDDVVAVLEGLFS